MLSRFASFLTLAACALSSVNAAAIPKRADPCNGRPEFCDRSYGSITFIGAHNSYAHSKNPLALSRNQQVDVKEQLKRGVRLLQGQGHQKDGKVHLCHTSCDLLDAGPAENYFKDVKGFLDANPREVLTIIMTNPEGLDIDAMWGSAFKAAGLDQMAFIPQNQPVPFDKWPTLGEMINSGKRVVIFMDSGANAAKVPFILPEFDNIWENQFSTTDPAFPCKVDRIAGPLSPQQHMYMINHSLNEELFGIPDLVIPNFLEALTTNSVQSIVDNANRCAPLAGNRKPNFVLLDWIDLGEPFKAADKLNGFA